MRKYLILILLFILPLGAILTALDVFYTYSITRHPLYGIPVNKSYDLLIVGDSRVSSILEDRLDSMTGGSTIVIPVYGGNLEDLNRVIEHFFQKGNSAKNVISSIDLRIGGNVGLKHDWLFYAYESQRRRYLDPRLPFAMYARNNKEVTMRKIIKDLKGKVDTSRTEMRDMSIVQWYKPHRDQMKDYSSMTFRTEAIEKLKDCLRSHGVKDHRLLIAPVSPDFDSYQSNPDGYKSLLKSHGFRFYDFSDQFTDTSDFADLVHLKRSRYALFTTALADSLASSPHGL